MTVVYLDRVLLLNLLVDYLLLLTTAQLAGIPLRRGRLALCAAVGALYAGAVFLPGLGWLSHPLCRTAVGAAMALTAWRREAHPWRLTALFFLLAGGLGGLVLALGLASGSVAAYVGKLYRAEISWPVLLGAEWLLIYWLTQAVGLTHFPLLMIGSLLTLLPVALISRYRHQRDWRTLLLQGAALTAAALLQSLPWLWHGKESWNALLLTLTGGLTLAPICLVFWHYLANNTWLPLGPSLVSQPINWRGRHLVWYLLLFVISLWLQLGLPDELSRFTPFCLALPIIALAWHYGWQGALIATLMNAIALIASQTWRDHPVDLLLSLLVQSLTGLLLGAGIQRLRELNQSLQKELARNQHLAERLLETEESVRRDVARELHDDIGQTITAIRTQAGIVQRLAADNASVKQSGQLIEQLSLGVYDAVRRLLGRLRPRQLDDLTLEQAIRSLMREMELEGRGIVSHLEWRIDESALSENQRVTLFRVCQEGLNNIVKHADASAVTLQGWQQDERLMLVIEDDGSGLPPGSGQQGFGLTGMRERVTALGGTLHISCLHGTRVSVSLPQRYV